MAVVDCLVPTVYIDIRHCGKGRNQRMYKSSIEGRQLSLNV